MFKIKYSPNYINLIHLGTEIKILILSRVYTNNDPFTDEIGFMIFI